MAATGYITRNGTKRFTYRDTSGKLIRDSGQLEYLASLGTPPAWKDVRIAKSRQAKVLVTGTDGAGRKQYIYNPSFRARQEQAKFDRILRFAKALPKMRKTIETDLRRKQYDYQKVMATVVSIMDRTHIRVGNESYAKQNESYGLTTLRSKHTDVSGNTIVFDFIGKSGKHHVKRIQDRQLARIVRQLDELPGYEVFKYYDTAGNLHDVGSADVNQYIKDVMGDEFSAKDFRTWAGTLMASAELLLLQEEDTTDAAAGSASERERKKCVTACVKKVAKRLGNTPAVARASYIDPRILDMYMKGGDLAKVRKAMQTLKKRAADKFVSPEERCVLQLLA